ncbi:unnamed protein product, partial [marine sediment metagenome]
AIFLRMYGLLRVAFYLKQFSIESPPNKNSCL